MHTLRVGAATALVALALPFITHAATLLELQAQIARLMTQLSSLQQGSAPNSAPSQPATPSQCPNLTRTLSRGMKGTDITQLQNFLISQNLLAPDSATGFFGALTEGAVKKFQCAQNIICSGTPTSTGYGTVGAKTRAAITVQCRKVTVSPTQSSQQPPPPANSYAQATYYTQGTYTSCTPLPQETRTQSCPAGQVGSITQKRTYVCAAGATSPVWGEWITTIQDCVTIPAPPPVSSQPSLTVLDPLTQSKMYFNDWSKQPLMNVEVTPWSLGSGALGGWKSFFVSTNNTYLCSTPDNMFALSTTKSIAQDSACRFKQGAALTASTVEVANSLPLWKRDYWGAFSGHILSTGSNSWSMYLINHGEMASYDPSISGLPYCVPAPNMGYGLLDCAAANFWGSYNAFIGMSSIPYTEAGLADSGGTLTTDFGPITWPSNGYIETLDGGVTWVKATDGGVTHPSSIIANGYLYVYYIDSSLGKESEGRGPGVKVMRAPVTSSGVDPASFKTYFNGSFTDAALPPGFTTTNYHTKWSVKGGRASSLFPSRLHAAPATPGTGRTDARQVPEHFAFSVAKVKGTDWYISVANERSPGVTVRLSKDLVTWGDAMLVPGTAMDYWAGGVDLQKIPLLYPRLANVNGDSNTEIDPNDFYIIGTQTAQYGPTEAKVVNQIRVKLNLP